MTDVINLNEQRAVKNDDSTLWTAENMLEAMLRDIRAGVIKPDGICIHYFEPEEDGTESPLFYVAGMTMERHVALLNLALHQTIDRWRGR